MPVRWMAASSAAEEERMDPAAMERAERERKAQRKLRRREYKRNKAKWKGRIPMDFLAIYA